MADTRGNATFAFGVPLLAAFVWSTYYFFVYAATPGVGSAALVSYPFLAGGIAYYAWARRMGHGDAFLALFRSGRAWVRVGLLAVMQITVLASTYTAGAIDTSLLTLVGDVVLTPLVVMFAFAEGRERLESPAFLAGIVLCAFGAALTIVAGGTIEPLVGYALIVGPLVPIVVPAFFVTAARASRAIPASAVMGQACLATGAVTLLLAPLLPGGTAGLWRVQPLALGLTVTLGLTSFWVAPALYFAAVDRAGLILPTILMGAVPVFTLGLSWALLGVVPPPIGLAGIPIAVGGAVLALRGGPLADTSTHPREDRIGPPSPGARADGGDGPGSPAAGTATRIR